MSRRLAFSVVALTWMPTTVLAEPALTILSGTKLSPGFGMGVNSSERRHDWLSPNEDGVFRLAYPAGQSWGAVFITVGGDPKDPPRPHRDFRGYATLVVEMKGATGGEHVKIGIKDADDPDDGSETQISEALTSEWREYKFPVSRFRRADLARLYVVCEFVFSGPTARTILVRKVSLRPS